MPAPPLEARPLRIAFYGNFGSGNLGNECTLQSVADFARRHLASSEMLCICTVPEDVRSRHGMPAVLATARATSWSWKDVPPQGIALPTDGAPEGTAGGAGTPGRVATVAPGTPSATPRPRSSRLFSLPVKVLRLVFKRLPTEALHWLKAYRTIRGFDVLIVPGTQVVSDYLCGPSGWPYDLFKWSTVAAARGVRLVFLSVGVGPVTHPLSRWFIRKSLQRAVYRSYRDEISMQCARGLGLDTSRDAVCPDLAFGLQDDVAPPEIAAAPRPGVIGIGLKDRGALGDPRAAAAYHGYLRSMATFTEWLCRSGYRVRLLLGDVQYDTPVGEDFTALLRERLDDSQLKLIVAEPAHSLKELVLQLASTDAVVSPRFHSLLLAAVLGKPLVALSDHFKIDMLMEGLGIPQYTMSLETLDADPLIKRFQSLLGDAERVRAQIRASVTRSRLAAYAQYREIFSRFGSDGASPAAFRSPQTGQQA